MPCFVTSHTLLWSCPVVLDAFQSLSQGWNHRCPHKRQLGRQLILNCISQHFVTVSSSWCRPSWHMVSLGAQLLSLTFITSRVLDCSFCFVEKGKPRPPSRSQTQHSSQKDPGGEDEKADAERRVLEKKRRGGALENGDEVWLWSCY